MSFGGPRTFRGFLLDHRPGLVTTLPLSFAGPSHSLCFSAVLTVAGPPLDAPHQQQLRKFVFSCSADFLRLSLGLLLLLLSPRKACNYREEHIQQGVVRLVAHFHTYSYYF